MVNSQVNHLVKSVQLCTYDVVVHRRRDVVRRRRDDDVRVLLSKQVDT